MQSQHQVSTLPEVVPSSDITGISTLSFLSRSFTQRLVTIWSSVERLTDAGLGRSKDDRYFLAYRESETHLLEVCKENELLKSKLDALECTPTAIRIECTSAHESVPAQAS